MNTVDLKDEYRTETNKDVYSEDTHYGGNGSYSDEYVKWLESKLNNNFVSDLVISTLRVCATGCNGIVVNGVCNSCKADWR